MRIDKLLSELKYVSRSQSRSFMKKHHIMYQGIRIIDPSFNVDPFLDIYIDEVKLYYNDPIYLALNKPKGYISATKDQKHPCITDLLKEPYNRFDFSIAGRLDIDTTGLIILTTDGQFIHEITHPKKHVDKVYEATLDDVLTFEKSDMLLQGVMILDDKKEAYLAKASHISFEGFSSKITIDEGKFHQVKRMFEAIGYKVLQLKRIKIGKLLLNDLEEGIYKEIRKEDIFD
ncbi:MAG: pseudouridine synthase [Acholeplasmataceae bacterium]